MDGVILPVQTQYGNPFVAGIDDPVFGDAGLGVLLAFLLEVAPAVFGPAADDFHYQIGALPEFVAYPIRMFLEHKNDVRFADRSGPELDPDAGEQYGPQVADGGKGQQ